jgi:hypothetical protein
MSQVGSIAKPRRRFAGVTVESAQRLSSSRSLRLCGSAGFCRHWDEAPAAVRQDIALRLFRHQIYDKRAAREAVITLKSLHYFNVFRGGAS